MSKLNIKDLKCCGNCKYFFPLFCTFFQKKINPEKYCNKWQYDNLKQENRI
jgi:hypothetical protein